MHPSAEHLRVEYDIQHHIVLSRRNKLHHALIRTVVSTLPTSEELRKIRRRDVKVREVNGRKEYSIKLRGSGRARVVPIDDRTGKLLLSLPDEPFKMSDDEIDEIIGMYSPEDRKYDLKKLKKAVISFLKDASLGLTEFESLRDATSIRNFMIDFNPLYSGMWDLDDDEVAEDFILNYVSLSGIKDPKTVAEILGESEKRVRKILESGRKGLLSLLK